jgi:hypothetical protein
MNDSVGIPPPSDVQGTLKAGATRADRLKASKLPDYPSKSASVASPSKSADALCKVSTQAEAYLSFLAVKK